MNEIKINDLSLAYRKLFKLVKTNSEKIVTVHGIYKDYGYEIPNTDYADWCEDIYAKSID
jgi:hypothetical protein